MSRNTPADQWRLFTLVRWWLDAYGWVPDDLWREYVHLLKVANS